MVFLTAALGVFLAIPMKRQMINQEQLPFPSGIAAAETAVDALGASGAVGDLDAYQERLEASSMLADLRHARNYRQVFKFGLFVGTPLSRSNTMAKAVM